MALSEKARERLAATFGFDREEQEAAKELADALDCAGSDESTATSANVPSTPVKRNALGNFAAGTITANLTGAASANVLKAGDTVTGNMKFQGDIILDSQNKAIRFQDSHDPALYDSILHVESDATIHIGGINTNGVTIGTEQEYKAMSAVVPGAHIRIASLDADNTVNIGSGNAKEVHFHTGGTNGEHTMSLLNGGDLHVKKHILSGDSLGGTVLDGNIDIVEAQAGNPANGTAGIGIASYRDSDEWGSFCFGVRYRGPLNAPTAVHNGDYLMEFGSLGWDGAGGAVGGGELAWVVDGVVAPGQIPSKAVLSVTTAAGVTTPGLSITPDLGVETFGVVKSTGFAVGATPGIDHTEVINGKTFVWSKGILISVT